MAADRVERRLAAIIAADVVGYSALIRADEEGARAAVRRLVSDIVAPQIAIHRGRIFKTMGDGLLAEFSSVVAAVRCAVDIQNAVADANAGSAAESRIEFRIGVNLGDVMAEGDDLHGDGVNVAARLEGLAEPRGICISGSAFEQVRDKLAFGFEDLGDQQVKNIDRPVRAYRVLSDPSASGKVLERPPKRAIRWKLSAIAAVIIGIAAAAGLAWKQPWATDVEPASAEPLVFPLPDKPSIAVLPFENLGGDGEQAYFADGIAEDVITDLSKLSSLFVIARNSSFQYRGEAVDVKQVGRALGVRYVLEGSVRRAGDQVRINAQLIDAQTGGHLWAERYDGTVADVFELQDNVTAQIVASLSLTLSRGERTLAEQRETSVPEAYDAFLVGWQHFRARTVDDYRQAQTWLTKAVTIDPDYGRAWATLASLYLESFQRGWTGQLGIDSEEFPKLLDNALRRPTPLAYRVEAEWFMQQKQFSEAEAALNKASALDPNDPDTYVLRSLLVAVLGDADAAIALIKKANRLDPHYPAFNLYLQGVYHLRAGDVATAIQFLERAQTRNPGDWLPLLYLTVAYAEAERMDDAVRTANVLVERRRELGFSTTETKNFADWWNHVGVFGERVVTGLGKAGIPDDFDARHLNLTPEYRLSGAHLRAQLKSGYRNIGRMPDGVWMRDMNPQGNGVHYWQGSRTATSTSEIRGDTQYTKRSNGMEQSCTFYRNPEGTKENLDEFVAVCSNGVFPFAQFRLPEKTR